MPSPEASAKQIAEGKVRIFYVVPEEIRTTLRIAAAEEGVTMSDLVCTLITKNYPEIYQKVTENTLRVE